MSWSTESRNTIGLSALSSAAILVNRSKTCCFASAPRRAHEIASRKVRRHISSPVTGVDADVSLGEVAGPEARRASAFAAHGQADLALRGVQLLLQLVLGKARGEAATAHRHTLQVDIDAARIEGHAGIARRGKDAAPVGIRARHGR